MRRKATFVSLIDHGCDSIILSTLFKEELNGLDVFGTLFAKTIPVFVKKIIDFFDYYFFPEYAIFSITSFGGRRLEDFILDFIACIFCITFRFPQLF